MFLHGNRIVNNLLSKEILSHFYKIRQPFRPLFQEVKYLDEPFSICGVKSIVNESLPFPEGKHRLNQFFLFQAINILSIHPIQFFKVEDGTAVSDSLKGKIPYQLLSRKKIPLLPRGPSHEGEKIEKGDRK